MNTVRTRIAPSPTGIAHIGTAYMALFNYAFAQKYQGQFIVRIEDTDRARFVKEAENIIYDSLHWLEIPYAEGADIGGPHAPYRQSERLVLYQKAVDELLLKEVAYYCFCSPETLDAMRQDQQKKKEISRYDRRCLKLSKTQIQEKLDNKERHVVRMVMPDAEIINWKDLIRGEVEINTKELDDQVLMKSDGFPTYHLAVVVDDNAMEITHIIRGEEWISSTPKHILLYRYFGWKQPEFAHMPLLRNPDKSKMSKRKNDVSIPSYKEKGYLPEALRNYLCLLGWSHPEEKELFDLNEFIEKFTIDRIQKTGPIFDMAKLTWMNQQYIQKMDDAELTKRILAFYPERKLDQIKVKQLVPLLKTRMETLKDFHLLTEFFFNAPTVNPRTDAEKDVVVELGSLLSSLTEWTEEEILSCLKIVLEKYSIRMPVLYYLFTGLERGLPLPQSLVLLGKQEVLQRLAAL